MRQVLDMELISRCKAGDQKAFADLFDFYYRPVYNYIHTITKEEAEDLTMVTLEKVFSKLDKYYPFYSFKTWLFKVALNTTLDYLRYRKPEPVELSEAFYLKSRIEAPDQRLISRENVKEIRLRINELTEKRREIVIMRTMGMKCREIAEETNVGINTITGQLRNIKRKLAV